MTKNDISIGEPLSIDNIFSLNSGKRYVIPRYQRAFSWEKGNAEKLWKDISNILQSDDEDYFIGSIVLSQSDKTPIIEVIDGQQRLTALSLLILALFLEYNKIDSKKATTHILKYLKIGDIDDEYEILTLSRTNLKLFGQLINIETKEEFERFKNDNYKSEIKSNKNLIDILDYFIKKVHENESSDENLEKTRLNNLLKSIRDNIFFIRIKVPDYAQASKLFEVLNNRGVDLTKADLIKNYLFSLSEQQSSLVFVEEDWNKLEDNINIDKFEQFFRYFSLIYSKEDDIYLRMENCISNKSARTVSDLIVKHSNTYKKLLDSSYSDNDEESELLDELKILGVTQYYSFMMSAYSTFNIDEIINLLQFMIKFTFRYSTICGKNPNKVENLYGDLAYTINLGTTSINDIKTEIIKLNPTDEEFKINFNNKEFKSTKIPRYILGKIENHISSDEKVIDFESVHLEHIMPKKIEKWILEDGNYKELHQKYLNNIGNMVLLSEKINTSIKNKIFSEKIISYSNSEINLMKNIKSLSEWKENEILLNRDRHYSYVKDIWKLDE